MSDVDLIINVHTNGIKDITNLSAATRALALNLRGITVPMTKLDAHSRAVSKALGMTNRSMNDHAKSVKQMVANQKALGAETKRVQSNIKSYAMAIQSAGGTHTVFGRELIQSRNELKAFSSTLRGLRIRAFGSDLASISLKLQRIGKDAQFVGRSLMINLTAPILLFARMGFQSLLKVDEQLVRLTKVLEGVAMSTEQANLKLKDYSGPDKQARIKQMTDSFVRLNASITESSTKFGVAKDLVAGLAVDFAELGITANENIVALTNLTLAAEKLGSMDASGAQDLASALYFNATRAYEVAGAFDNVTSAADRESKAIASATVQLNMFNTIENVTALSLKDLADSLPELGGMALSFGLSMTEAAALLAPMKAAGFDVGASANSIKVSLQRAIVPTKQNVELLARLSKQYGAAGKAGNAFSETTKTGLTGLQAIVDIFGKVVEGGKNTEAGLKLMSDLFEKRQGPRMYIAIEQLTQFDAALKNVNRNRSPERLLASAAEGAIVSFNKLNGTTLPETITQFSDIGVVARIAASEVGAMVDGFTGKGAGGSITQKEKEGAIAARKAVADLIKQKKLNEDVDLISEVKTQSGRAMLVELAGASSAQDVANMELEQSLNSLSTATQRIKIAFKNFAADIIRYTTPALKKFSDFITNFYRKWQSLSETTRERISKLILVITGFLAALAPAILALGTMQASVGVLGRGITFFLPKLKGMELGLAGVAGGAKKATAQLTNMYNSFVGKKQLSSIVPSFLPASGSAPLEGMIGMPKRSGTNIRLPGNVAPTPDSLFDADGNPLTGRARAAVITKNRTARLSHAARGRGAVDQYLRNEASMLSANDMRLNARGRVIGAKGSFVGRDILGEISKASVLREAALTDAGISRTGAGGARLATKRGLVDISESRALRIARGGIGGQIARRTAALPGLADSFTSATGVTGRGFLRGMLPGNGKLVSNVGAANVRGIASAAFNAGPVAAYTKSVQGAKAAVQAMRIEQMALGGGAGRIRTMTTAMGGFMKSTKLGTVALKLMKIALISSGIGAIMLGIGVAVYIIVKNFDKFKDKASGAILRVKNAWGIFKSAIESLIKPFVDLFSMFDSGSKKGGSAVGGLSKAFDVVAKVIQKVAQWFKMLVENFIQPYLYMIIDIVMFVVSIFKGNWGDAFNFLVAAVSGAVKLVIKLIAALLKGMVWITAGGIKLIIGYFTLIPKAVAKVFSFLERIPGVGGIFGWIGDSINFVIDGLYGLVDAGKNAASGAIDAVADAAIGLLDQGVKRGVSGAAGEISDDTKVPAAAEKAGEEAGEIMGNSFGNGFEDSDASGKIAKSISEGLNDAIQQLQDYVAGELGNALSKFVDESVKALEKQKASALKVFDVQIKTLGKLEKAEESLTKKKEYETNRRKIIDNQALSNEQFRRNYALAVYEGRIDDARMLQLQQSADEKGFSQDLLTIEQERARDLAKENLDALKEAINEAKDAASLFFEESITKFQESAALITKIAPVTVEQYTEQLNQLQQLTETNATNMNTTFGSMFEAFATTIADKMPNKVVGPFATNLDELVLTAKEKFGLGSDKSENTVIGITLGMLSEVGATFGDGRQSVIDSFGTITTGIATNFSEMKTKFLEEVKSDFIKNFKAALDAAEPTKVFNQAIIDGNLSILRSFQNMVDLNPALMEKLKKSLDPAIEGYIKLKAAADAAKDAAEAAADAGAGGGEDGTSGTSSSSNLTGTYAGTSRLDAFVKNNELRAARSLRALTYQEFIGNYKGFKKGGIIPSRTQNQNQGYPEGFIPAPTQEGVPTLLHGGEYILNAKAVQRIGVGALNKMNNNLIPKFIKGGVVPGGKKGTASNTRGTADRVEQQIKKTADEPYNWKNEKGLNFVEKAIFKASDFAIGTGKFAANTVSAAGQTGVIGVMSLANAALGLIETAIPSKSQNPLKNIAARQNDLLYGTGASIPFVPRKYGQLTTVGKPYSVTMNELKAYERMSGENIPGWKKTAYAIAGDRGIMDAIGIATMGGGSLVNSAVKTGVARAATSKLGTSILTATLGEGGAAALSGTLTSAANKAGTQRLATVLSNKNLLGRIQSSYATMTGGAKTPVAPELIGLNNLYDPTGAIKQTFGKAPSTLIADVLNGRMVIPEGGFAPKFGSIGTGSFIDTTLAGEASSMGGGLEFLKNTLRDYQVASSLIDAPLADVSAGINRSVFSTIGGKAATGVKNIGSTLSNIGSSIKYSKPVQSTLNTGTLTLAGLSGRKGLEYGLMATGLKPAPLGISPSQLRSASWLSSTVGPLGSSLFSAARRAPDILKSIESQFGNLSETELITSPVDLFDTFIAGNAGRFDSARHEITQKGLNSFASNSADYISAKRLLKEDAYAMLQAYYGPGLQRFGSPQSVIDELSNLLNQAIIDHQINFAGSTPIASILRRDIFLDFIKKQDPSNFAFYSNQFRGSSFNPSVIDTLTGDNRYASGLQGSFREVFRSIEQRLVTDPANTRFDLASLIGTEKDMAERFTMQMPQYSAGGTLSNGIVTGGITDRYPPNGLTNPGLSKIQKIAREYLLTSNLVGSPYLAFDIESILRKEFELPMNATDLQDYAGDFGAMNSINPNSNSPYKSSLFLKSKLAQNEIILPGVNGSFGALNELLLFDQIYDNLWNSWQLAVQTLRGIDPQSTAFPLWSPTWEDFNDAWVSLLDDIVESVAAPVNGSLVMNPYLDITDNLATNPEAARNAVMEEITARLARTSAGSGDLQGSLANLHLQSFIPNTGELAFSNYNQLDPSSNWFYGLRNGREMIAPAAFNPVNNINEVVRDVASGNSVFYSMDPATISQRTVNAGYSPQSNYSQLPPVDQNLQLENVIRALKRRQEDIALQPPFDRQKLSELFRKNVSYLDANLPSSQVWSNAPSTWSYSDEANIQSYLDNLPGTGRPSMAIPVPDGFPDVVRTILGQDSSEEYIKAVWLDFLKTKDIFFKGTGDLSDIDNTFNMDTIAQNPFKENEFNTLLFQHNSPLVNLDYLSSLIDPYSSSNILGGRLTTYTSKMQGTLEHFAGTMIAQLRMKLIEMTGGQSVLLDPAVQSLDVDGILKSKYFASFFGIQDTTGMSGNPIDNFIANLPSNPFDEIRRSAKILNTGQMFSADTGFTPEEINWVALFAEKLKDSGLDLDFRMPFPAADPGRGEYTGLRIPSSPSDYVRFKNQKFNREIKPIGTWFNEVLGLYTNTSQNVGTGTTISRLRLDFLDSLSNYFNGKGVGAFYSDYFDESINPSLLDPSVREKLEKINQIYLSTSSSLSRYPKTGINPGSETAASSIYQRALMAASMLQNHRMAATGVVANFSGSVSQYAQRIAEHSLPLAPLIAAGTNPISPFGQYALNTSVHYPNQLAELIAPSALIEIIGLGIKKQGLIGSLLPESDVRGSSSNRGFLTPVNKSYLQFGIPKFKTGGYVPGSPSTAIPAILHGGEYVINADAVRNMGVRTMQSINQSKFRAPSGAPMYAGGGQTTNVSTVNINVDTFIGEEEWFKGMMRDYNINVLPKQQKASGLESRTFTSYNGIQGF